MYSSLLLKGTCISKQVKIENIYTCTYIFNGVSLSEPTLIMTMVPMSRIMITYHLPCVCCTLVAKIHARPEVLCLFRYIDVLTCVAYNYMQSTEQHEGDMSYSCLP